MHAVPQRRNISVFTKHTKPDHSRLNMYKTGREKKKMYVLSVSHKIPAQNYFFTVNQKFLLYIT